MQPTWVSDCGRFDLWLGDCMELLPSIGQSFDTIITDAPYGLGEKMQGGTWGAKDEFSGFLKWDLEAKQSWFDSLVALNKPMIFWGGNYYLTPIARCWLIWNKSNAVPTMADFEMAWTNLDKPAKRFDGIVGRVQYGHPTSKPYELMAWCLSHVADSQVIFDPFMGTGTTGVVCARHGKKFIGVEIDPTYFETAKSRITKALRRDAFLEGAFGGAKA